MQLLAAAVGNCLSDSLLFALRKFKQAPEPISARSRAEVGRNAEDRLRVLGLRRGADAGRAGRRRWSTWTACSDQFEAFCTVASSVSQGIPVRVAVLDADWPATEVKEHRHAR